MSDGEGALKEFEAELNAKNKEAEDAKKRF